MMKKCKVIISMILALVMLASLPAFAADTVVNDTYYVNKDYENKAGATGYVTEDDNTYRVMSASGLVERQNVSAGFAPTQNIVIKFDFRVNDAGSANTERLIASVTAPIDSTTKEFKIFKLDGTDLKYGYSANYVKDSNIDISVGKWHSIAIEYTMTPVTDGDSVTYTKTYDLYLDGKLIADDIVDGYTNQATNTYTRITLWASSASAESPIHVDNICFFDGKLGTSSIIGFNDNAVFKGSKLLVDKDAEIAKTDVTSALASGTLENIYSDSTLASVAENVTDGCVALINTPDGKYSHTYELTSNIFEEDFNDNSTHTETITAGSTRSTVRKDASDSSSEIIYDKQYATYALGSSAEKSLTQTEEDKYCSITTGTSVVNDGYPRIEIRSTENVFPIAHDFTTEMSVFFTGNAAHGMDLRLSSGSISLGGDNQDLDKYNLNAWNKISVQADFEEGKLTASLFINGEYIRKLSKTAENLTCNSIRYFSHPLNTLTQNDIRDIYNANGGTLPEELLGTPVEFDDGIDNIRIIKGLYDGSSDVSVVNSEIPVRGGKVYADLSSLEGLAENFAGENLVKVVNPDGTTDLKEGSVILVKTESGDFWNAYTVTDITFKILSFAKNADGTNATATLNNHTTEDVVLIAAVYEGDEFVTMYTADAKDNSDVVTLAESIELSEGQTVKFMLWESLETPVPYCTTAE